MDQSVLLVELFLKDLVKIPSEFLGFPTAFAECVRFLAYRPDVEGRIYRVLDYASSGSPGHGSTHLLVPSGHWFCLGLRTRRVDSRWPSASAHDGWACATLSKCKFLSMARLSCCGPLQASRLSRGIWFRHVWVSSTSCLFPLERKKQNVVESHFFWNGFYSVRFTKRFHL